MDAPTTLTWTEQLPTGCETLEGGPMEGVCWTEMFPTEIVWSEGALL